MGPVTTPAGASSHTAGDVASRSTAKARTVLFVARSVAMTGTTPPRALAAVKVYTWLRMAGIRGFHASP
jgi:hypothetical protein